MTTIRRFKFSKLVRSKLPEILTEKGMTVHSKKIENKQEKLDLLKTKVNEELTEAYGQKTKDMMEKDLSDAFAALMSIASTNDIDLDTLIARAQVRAEEDGELNDTYIDYIEIPSDNPGVESFASRPSYYPEC